MKNRRKIEAIENNIRFAVYSAYKEVFVKDELNMSAPHFDKMLSLAAKIYNTNMKTSIGASFIQNWLVFQSSLDIYLRLNSVKKISFDQVERKEG